jgi:hydroxypyruvate isomerase
MLEPIGAAAMPGYFMNHVSRAEAIIARLREQAITCVRYQFVSCLSRCFKGA